MSDTSEPEQPGEDTGGEFGPRGYLPDRAAARARKIILREPLGLAWPIASLVAAAVVLVVGGVYLVTRTGPPSAPSVAVAELDELEPRSAETRTADGVEVVLLRAGGGVRAFLAPDEEVRYCADVDRVEGAHGAVWDTSGRRTGGDGPSLERLPARIYDEVVYVDPTAPAAPPAPRDDAEQPAC